MESSRNIKNLNTILHGSKSVPNLCAQSTTLCEVPDALQSHINKVEALLCSSSNLSILEKAIIELLYNSGCRISEILSIKSNSITRSGQIFIKGSKKSSDRVIQSVLFRRFWIDNKLSIQNLLSNYNRFYFYRLFKNNGLAISFESKKNKSVTHSFRHLYINSLADSNISNLNIQSAIGHKSIKSQEFYKKK